MVPCTALLIGGPNADYGHFFHHNTQHEIVLTLAANGSYQPVSSMSARSSHGVNSFLKNEKESEIIRHVCHHTNAGEIRRANGGLQACAARSATSKSSSRNLMLLRRPMQSRQPIPCRRLQRYRGCSRSSTTTRRATSALQMRPCKPRVSRGRLGLGRIRGSERGGDNRPADSQERSERGHIKAGAIMQKKTSKCGARRENSVRTPRCRCCRTTSKCRCI